MCFFCISKFKYLLKIGLNFKLLILFLIDLLAYPPFHLLLILRYSLLKHTFAKCTDCGGTPCGVAALWAHCRCLHVRTGEAGGLAACQLSPDFPVPDHLTPPVPALLGRPLVPQAVPVSPQGFHRF